MGVKNLEEQELESLERRKEKVIPHLIDARKDFLSARARKSYWESQMEKLEKQIIDIKQGQLFLPEVD